MPSSSKRKKDEIKYTMPRGILDKFILEALKNKNDGGNHNQTIAIVTGTRQKYEITAIEIIFPCQKGSLTEVGDHGKSVIFSDSLNY